jgi:hypothetical protein
VIVVVGRPGARIDAEGTFVPAGVAAEAAMAIAAAGSEVEVVGSIGDDDAGDAVAVALSRAGVRHTAMLRDPAGTTLLTAAAPTATPPRLDARDLDLGLRYIPDCRVIILAEPLPAEAERVAIDAAAYHGATLVALVPSGGTVSAELTAGAVLVAAGTSDDAVSAALARAGTDAEAERRSQEARGGA